MELEKKYTIQDNFIGIFDNFFPTELIDNYLKYYHYCEKQNLTFGRENQLLIKDEAVIVYGWDLNERLVPHNNEPFIHIFYKEIYPLYVEKFSVLKEEGTPNTIHVIKIQKTKPTEGFHVWHCEAGHVKSCRRIFAFTFYLNDVTEGGETEFLYQKCRVKPIKNRFVLWPAGITHIHRGNPPLSNEKYILTGWVEYT